MATLSHFSNFKLENKIETDASNEHMRVKPRILVISPSLAIGGAEIAAIKQADGLAALPEYTVEFCAATQSSNGSLKHVRSGHLLVHQLPAKRLLSAFWKICGLLRKTQWDVIVSHQRYLNILVLIAAFLTRCKAPVIAVEHAVPLFIFPWATGFKDRLFERIAPFAYKMATSVVMVSPTGAEILKRSWPGVADKISFCPNPVIERNLVTSSRPGGSHLPLWAA